MSTKTEVLSRLLKVSDIAPNVLAHNVVGTYMSEVYTIVSDFCPPLPKKLEGEKDVKVSCLTWWKEVTTKCPLSFKMVVALLSVYHGPRVGSCFSRMMRSMTPSLEDWRLKLTMRSKLLVDGKSSW